MLVDLIAIIMTQQVGYNYYLSHVFDYYHMYCLLPGIRIGPLI